MNTFKKVTLIIALISGITLLNLTDPMLAEAGKALIIISILGFGALASYHLSELHETEDFSEFQGKTRKVGQYRLRQS